MSDTTPDQKPARKGFLDHHRALERNATLLLVGSLFVVSIGGIVEIAPLFYLENTIEEVEGMRPYAPLELKGREIYIREGCYVCHSQMIRPMRDEVERYGHYSLAAESMYDHPFQWGSKRTGPDLARVGGRYSDDWHVDHFMDPQSVVPESIMPKYAFLADNMLDGRYITDLLETHRMVGVPYTDDMIANAGADFRVQSNADGDWDGLLERYPGAQTRNFDGQPGISEMDALIAYMQMLGTLVDFSTFTPDETR
ncbi:cytochrome-c oxidase, cbb3-type subunit II [Actibacterium sp. 188UL27-1]|uniref:cytochrome-c oxidase, cbb3-type subunit II n=1 Tax=Actibacterium sp. 188UL27-1 TaxID=2786961 RepID=UPI00195F07A2|nr:cytochrome-c oxidase, cbb3-type subunit II [Actibacterium sp. 188UL27-1]MBM7068781.1 cytochrome-c oxidase, cbb3-type subunit II [Actibacterium sp. 188UL27-1]